MSLPASSVPSCDEQSPAVVVTSFCDLPDDVLLKIFSLLSLRTVLLLERLSRRLYRSVTAYLSTLKTINLYHGRISEDVFRDFNPQVTGDGGISDEQFACLLHHCPNATTIEFLPDLTDTQELSGGLSIDGIIAALTAQGKISRIVHCNSARLSDAIFKSLPHVAMDMLALHPSQPLSVLPNWNIRRLQIGGGTIDGTLPSLPSVEEIELLGVTIRCGEGAGAGGNHSTEQQFPRLRSFSCSVRIVRASFGRQDPFTSMLMAVVASPHLNQLTLSLENFDSLERITQNKGLLGLRVFILSSSGFYTAALQQQNYAGVVAEFCACNARSLERLSLPSSVLVKRFFQYFISNNCQLPELSKIEINGIADTKLFFAPGDLVEKQYYQQFLSLCPKISAVSLHAYSGSLPSLALPLGLSELTLPWDNRLNMQTQKANICAVVEGLPNLQRLSIAGVEEVEGVMQMFASPSRDVTDLKFTCESLTRFSISNVCVRSLDLSQCKRLTNFALHCCPALKALKLCAESLKQVSIYNNHLPEFLPGFIRSMLQSNCTPVCHLHIQLHAMTNDFDARSFAMVSDEAFMYVSSSLSAVGNQVDYCILRQSHYKRLEHNSGEAMYTCTEFQGISMNDFSRSKDEIRMENAHRARVLEGIRRWTECLAGTRALLSSKESCLGSAVEQRFDAVYCSKEYRCCTNMPWMLELNKSQRLVQPSSHEPSYRDHSMPVMRLNVPQLDTTPSQCAEYLRQSSAAVDEMGPWSKARPLLFVSIMEYLHNVHTLFFYS